MPKAGIAYINETGEYLFVRSAESGKWSLPKGDMEKDETSYQAAIREFKEETGVDLTNSGARLRNRNKPQHIANHNIYIFDGNGEALRRVWYKDPLNSTRGEIDKIAFMKPSQVTNRDLVFVPLVYKMFSVPHEKQNRDVVLRDGMVIIAKEDNSVLLVKGRSGYATIPSILVHPLKETETPQRFPDNIGTQLLSRLGITVAYDNGPDLVVANVRYRVVHIDSKAEVQGNRSVYFWKRPSELTKYDDHIQTVLTEIKKLNGNTK